MRHFGICWLFVVVVALWVGVYAEKYLTEKPGFLHSCHLSDAGFKDCFKNSFQVLFHEWKNGIEGLKTVGSLDPLQIKNIKIDHDNGNIVLHAVLTDIVVNGLSQGVVKAAELDLKKNKVNVLLWLPTIHMDSKANAKGRLLALNVNGDGRAVFEPKNVLVAFQADIKLYDDHGFTFTDILKLRTDIREVGDLHMHIEGVFGSKELEESANLLLNENWRTLYSVFEETLKTIIGTILHDRMKKVFAYVPSNYFIDDLPSAATLYG